MVYDVNVNSVRLVHTTNAKLIIYMYVIDKKEKGEKQWFDDAITCRIAVAQLEGSDQIVDSRVTCVVRKSL